MNKPPPQTEPPPLRMFGNIIHLGRLPTGRVCRIVAAVHERPGNNFSFVVDRPPEALEQAQQALLIDRMPPQPSLFIATDVTRVFVLLQQQRAPVVFAFRLPQKNLPRRSGLTPVYPLPPRFPRHS